MCNESLYSRQLPRSFQKRFSYLGTQRIKGGDQVIRELPLWVYLSMGLVNALTGCSWWVSLLTINSVSVFTLWASKTVWYYSDLDRLAWNLVYGIVGWAGGFLIINLVK